MEKKTGENTYPCKIVLNGQKIEWLTITDYCLKHEKHGITKSLVRKLVNQLDHKEVEPQKGYKGDKVPFVEEISYHDKRYRLIFWFKNGAVPTNHLWVKNCYPCKKKKKS